MATACGISGGKAFPVSHEKGLSIPGEAFFVAGSFSDGSGWVDGDRGFTGQHAEGEAFLNVKLDRLGSMIQIANREILPDIERQITAARCDNKCAFNGWSPDDLAVNHALKMSADRVPVIIAAADGLIGLGAEHDRIRTVDASQTQFVQSIGDDVGVVLMMVGSVRGVLDVASRIPLMPAGA